ncbi:MAG: ABC transporter ATP-binding protein [Candidatus Dormibacteria bacterium]
MIAHQREGGAPPPLSPLQVAPILEVCAVEHRFRNRRGVGPVDLSLGPGERTALMGSNGAGKTTLLRVLATATRPRRGAVRWCGSPAPSTARRLIGFAPDAALDDPGLTGRQSTYFWCRQWTRGDDVAVLAGDALRRFGLASVADEPIAGYSFGMRRRLALAQALAHRPRLALLDEPTAGLDADGLETLRAELATRSDQGHASLIASNDCSFVAAACDRVIFLDQGRVVVDATPGDLLASVGDARRVDLDVAEGAHHHVEQLRSVGGVASVTYVDGVVSAVLLDDSALASVVRVADGWPGGLRAVRLHQPDLSDAFRHLTGVSLDGTHVPAR